MDHTAIDANMPVQHSTRGLFTWWVGVHIIIALLGALGTFAFFPTRFLSFLATCVLLGSVAQEIALRRYLPNAKLAQWTIVTIAGALLGSIIGFLSVSFIPGHSTAALSNLSRAPITVDDIREAFRFMFIFLVSGGITGLAQTFVLRPYFRQIEGYKRFDARWSYCVATSWGLGAAITAIANLVALGGHQIPGPEPESAFKVFVQGANLFLGMVTAGIVTGYVLTRLLRDPLSLRQEVEDEKPQSKTLNRYVILVFSIISLVVGLFWLWVGYSVTETSFAWPNGYYGPGVTNKGGPPDEFFINARILAVSIVVLSLVYLVITLATMIRALRKPQFIATNPWGRYWSIALSSFIVLWLSCFWIFWSWYGQYTD